MGIEDSAERELAMVTRLSARTTPPLRGVKFVSARELLDQPTPTQWLVRKILAHATLTTIIGPPGSFKSNIALDVAASVATGIPWHGHATRQGAVFFIAGEGQHGINRRLKAWSIVRSADLENAPLYVSTGAVCLIEPLSAAEVSAEVQRIALAAGVKPQLLVVDTLARNFGPGDENSASDMGCFIANLDQHVRECFDCAILIVHHSGVIDSGRGRGSSALRAAVDTEIICDRSDRIVTVKCVKAKDAPEFAPLAFEARIVELPWHDDDGQPETSFVMHPVELSEEAEKTVGLGGNQKKAFEVLRAMYDDARANLVAANLDPRSALVTLMSWKERSGIDRHRFAEVRAGLEKRELITVEHPHVLIR